ncbi:MAG: hypothetical protein V4719_10780 [Planctomycetota bacterium]
MTPRIIVAKYVPDISRMEPRNIGVFLWSKGEFCAKFLDEVPFVNEAKTYERWKAFWSKMIAGDTIRPPRSRPVEKRDPKCVEALLSTQSGNYLLVDAGELLETVGKRKIREATEYLYNELVVPPEKAAKTEAASFKTRCDKLLSGLKLRSHYPVPCSMYGVTRPLHFSYGADFNNKPLGVIHRVILRNETSVNNAGLILRQVQQDSIIPRDNCAAMVESSTINSKAADAALLWLKGICPVIDVDGPNAAEQAADIIPPQSQTGDEVRP